MNGYNLTTMEKLDMFTCHFNRNSTCNRKERGCSSEEAPARTNTPVKNNTVVKNKESVKSNDSIKNVESSKPVVKEKPVQNQLQNLLKQVRLLVVVKLQ